MFIKHVFSYFVSRGLTGIVNFLALALYTRMLSTEDYGEYALIVATGGLVNSVFFQWIRLVLLRFLSKYRNEKNEYVLLSTLFIGYLLTLVALIFVTSLSLLLGFETFSITIGVLLLAISQSIFDIISELLRASLQTKAYGLLSVLKSTISLGLSLLLIQLGLGLNGVVFGLIIGPLLSLWILYALQEKKQNIRFLLQKENFHFALLKECVSYGLPLTATLSLSFVMNQSDRLLLGWMVGKSEAGIYSAAYDLTQQTIIMLMMIVNLASYPLCVRALETKGYEAAQKQIRSSAVALFLIAAPATIGMVVLNNSISSSILGEEFREKASMIIPVVAISVLLQGMKSYYLDLSFQLGKKTTLQIWPVLAGGVINIILNLVFIPVYGINGAVYATFIAYIAAFVLSGIIGKAVFPVSFPLSDFVKIVVCAMVMSIPLYFLDNADDNLYRLMAKVGLGVLVYFTMVYLLNVWEIREHVSGWATKLKTERK
ncbi:lipopolysaccharide biosynthesis protein [Geobacillus sp. C56-T3]|uniref:lipopolysaccharide biosynthesis protein n=1 Tax=Geobacillus sp. (strain C56-T3) TaxID=691437 RepID=UPI0001D58A11|nr:oligosaccharide flippase family protein [Geobacillus sp. C56-T3]ADI28218.1 polysaccharide biosynthesis protein [Geobacillus sp. C56-T3]